MTINEIEEWHKLTNRLIRGYMSRSDFDGVGAHTALTIVDKIRDGLISGRWMGV